MTVDQTKLLYTLLTYYWKPCLKCLVLNKILPGRPVSDCKGSIRMTAQMLLKPLQNPGLYQRDKSSMDFVHDKYRFNDDYLKSLRVIRLFSSSACCTGRKLGDICL